MATETEQIMAKLAAVQSEKEAALREAAQFRDDVAYLTQETDKLIQELKDEKFDKQRLEEDFRKV